MNPDTRVAVHCYKGDARQVFELMPLYAHHDRPVTILSPADSHVNVMVPSGNADCRWGGKAAIIGQDSLDRQAIHLRMLVEYPEHFFLANDSDSFCLSPAIPDYLYAAEDVLWSNMITDSMPYRSGLCPGPSGEPTKNYYPDGFPKLAFQPPYFFSRAVLEKLVAATERVTMNPHLPFIDHYMVQLAVAAGVRWAGFPDGFSGPISSHPDMPGVAYRRVLDGAVMIHGAKGYQFSGPLIEAYRTRQTRLILTREGLKA